MFSVKLRSLAAVMTLGAVAAAHGQVVSESTFQSAWTTLRLAGNSQWLHVAGSENVAGKVQPVSADVFYRVDSNLRSQVEIFRYRGSTYTEHVLMDGQTLWVHDLSLNTYFAQSYSASKNANRDGWQALQATAKGPAAVAVRLLKEVYAGTEAGYRSWLPTVTPYATPNTPDTYTYRLPLDTNLPPTRQVLINLAYVDSPIDPSIKVPILSWLSSYTRSTSARGELIEADYTMTKLDNPFPSYATFVFAPPRGARAIPAPRIGG